MWVKYLFIVLVFIAAGCGNKGKNNTGIGLKNMEQRMHKSGIKFSIENKNGTLLTLYRPKIN